jgi:DNA-binding CsgD family transcriptional regulator
MHLLKQIQQISKSLNIIDINLFYYLRVTTENKILILSNNQVLTTAIDINSLWDIYFVKNNKVQLGKLTILSLCKDSSVFCENLNIIKINNGILFILPLQNYVEIYLFGTDVDNISLNQIYLNNSDIIKRFIIHFKIKSKKIIKNELNYKTGNNFKIIYSNSCLNEQQYNVLKQISINDFKNISLSPLERLYLQNRLEGKTYSEISKCYKVNIYEIKKIMNSLKNRTGCIDKTELLLKFIN